MDRKEFTPYDIALALKELGFDEPCFAYWGGKIEPQVMPQSGTYYISKHHSYRNTYLSLKDEDVVIPNENDWKDNPNTVRRLRGIMVSAPLYQQVFRWFREKYNMHHTIQSYHCINEENPFGIAIDYIVGTKWGYYENLGETNFKTYEEAELACLRKLIEILKEKMFEANIIFKTK